MQIRGRKPKKQPIRAGGISASPPQATRGCAARCRGFAAFACARETQQYRQLRRLATLSKICALPFFTKASSLHLLGLQVIQLFFDHSKNCITNSFEQSISLHTGAIMVESSAYLYKQVVERLDFPLYIV